MSATGAGYDYSVSTFSPNGRVFQVEYAAKAVEKTGTAIGIRCVDGVVLGVEKNIISPLIMPNTNRRIFTADYHIGIAVSGLTADARQLVNKARTEAAEYLKFFGSRITIQTSAERLAAHVHTHTLYWYLRPFGCQILLCGIDEYLGPQLYAIDPMGIQQRFFATAIGKHKQAAASELEKLDFTKVTCRQAVDEIARLLIKLHDDGGKDKDFEIELSWIGKESDNKHVHVPQNIKDEAIRRGQEAKQKEDMEDSDDEDDKPATTTTATAQTAAA